MRWTLMLLIAASGGCSAYTEAQMRLVEQARHGVELVKAAQTERTQLVTQFHQLQRERLDEAFDADVRDRAELSADWVIEHRQAYAAGLDVLNRQRTASDQADAVTRRNLDAMDEALKRVLDLQAIQLRLMRGYGERD